MAPLFDHFTRLMDETKRGREAETPSDVGSETARD
jgi:hypothetical protein